jgi:hypothetical protein
MHIICLAAVMLREEPEEIIPTAGACPSCSSPLRWTQLITFLRKKHHVAQSKRTGRQPAVRARTNDDSDDDAMDL